MKLEKLMEKFERCLGTILVISGIILVISIIISPTPKPKEIIWQSEEEYEYEQYLDSIMKEELNNEMTEEEIVKVTATVYNPIESQCDSDPLITADNSKIDLEKLNQGKLKWIAVSRDLRKQFRYGSKVIIRCESDPSINGIYEVRDTMNERYRSCIDILKPIGQSKGKWHDVEISLLM